MPSTWIAMGRPVLDETGTGLEPVALMVSDDEGWLTDFVRGLLNPTPTPTRHGLPLDSYVFDGWCFQDIEVVGPVPSMSPIPMSLNDIGRGLDDGTVTKVDQVLRITQECKELVQVVVRGQQSPEELEKEMVDVVLAVARLAAQEGVDLDAAVLARVG